MPEYIKQKINQDISTEDIFKKIGESKLGKAPGPDGITIKLYKLCKEQVTPYVGQVMNDILNGKQILDSWNGAAITLIPKEGMDELEVKNYRPILLLNSDYKLFAGILADRLKEYLAEYINNDQVEFLPKRQLRDNISILMNVLEYADKNPGKKLGIICLDAEKAFNKLEWEFLKTMLEQMEIGSSFLNAIKEIYKEQRSYLIINDERTREFSLRKGTRQGCPLSPLLFIFVLEVFLIKVQECNEIKGLKLGKYEIKYRAYADDIMFVVEDPLNTIHRLFETVKKFCELAGFSINYNKTKIMCKNIDKGEEMKIQTSTGCEAVDKIKYLGIIFTKKNIVIQK